MAQIPPWLEALNQLGKRWIVDREKNEAAYMAVRNDAMLIIYAHEVEIPADLAGAQEAFASISASKPKQKREVPDYRKEATSRVLEYLDSYDPNRSDSLGAYIAQRLSWKLDEELKRENRGKQHVQVEEEEPSTRKTIIRTKTIPNVPLDEGFGGAGHIQEPSTDPDDIYDPTDDYISIMIAMVLNFKLKQKPSSSSEMNYQSYRMCFTEKITHIGYEGFPLHHEADIFHAMFLGYLDYFMREPCRDVRTLQRSPRKRLEELFPGELTGELTWNSLAWFPAKVPIAFLKSIGVFVSNSTISERRKKYTQELEALFYSS